MLFIMKFEEELVLSPNILSKNLKNIIKAKLIEKVQGSVTEKYGYLICVISIGEIPNGVILDTTGDILFKITYRAVVMKPFEGEVCDGVIDKIDEYGLHVTVGPFKVYISNSNFPPNFEYNQTNNIYTSENSESLKLNSEVRFRISRVQFIDGDFKPTGTMADNYLGPL